MLRLDGFIVQATGIVVLSSLTAEMLAFWSPAFEYLTSGSPQFDAALVLLMLVSVGVLMDVWVTPIPFRFGYIFPSLIINVFLVATNLAISGHHIFSRAVLLLAGTLALLVGYVLHIYGRAVYLWVHRKRVLAELNPPPPSAARSGDALSAI